MMGWYYGMSWGGWILMTVVMLAFWALVIFAVVAIFRGVGRGSGPAEGTSHRDPLEILQERFARGDIDVEEYEARAQVLRDARPDLRDKTAH